MRRPALSTAGVLGAASAGLTFRGPLVAYLEAHPEIPKYVHDVLAGAPDAASKPPESLRPPSLAALRRDLCRA
eukprot:783237-Lingulodinium_polyedra.AAC.1